MEQHTFYPGSVGELIQGNICGIDTLISCPVNLYTKVRIFENIKPNKKYHLPKAALFMKNLLSEWNCGEYFDEIDIEITSQIPHGKGFASSTADLCAVYRSLLKLFHRNYNEQELIRNCIKIEPTDSILFKELTLFDYKKGSFYNHISRYFEVYLLIFEGEKVIDTVEFNKTINISLASNDDIYNVFVTSIKRGDIKGIAQASEESIRRNCVRLNYDVFPKIEGIKNNTNGLGIMGAHSGDVLAIIYDDKESCQKALRFKDSIRGYKGYMLKTLDTI